MVYNFKVFKKSSPNGKVNLYMGKRDFAEQITEVEPIDGIVVLDEEYLRDHRAVFGQLICNFRYGREEDEVMGLNFHKELLLATEQIYPRPEKPLHEPTKLQERLLEKLGPNAFPFTFKIPSSAPTTVTLQQRAKDMGEPCGVQYFVKIFVGDAFDDRMHRRSTVALGIRKVQYATNTKEVQPRIVVRKDFLLSPGDLELEVTLDKQVYFHGEKIAVNIRICNNSSKTVKKIKATIQQGVDVVLFQNGQFRNTICTMETNEGCPLQPGSNFKKTMYLMPTLYTVQNKPLIALDGQHKRQDSNLASTTLLSSPDQRDAFGIIVSYVVKVKLYLGALGGECSATLPFVLMNVQPGTRPKTMSNAEAYQLQESVQYSQ